MEKSIEIMVVKAQGTASDRGAIGAGSLSRLRERVTWVLGIDRYENDPQYLRQIERTYYLMGGRPVYRATFKMVAHLKKIFEILV